MEQARKHLKISSVVVLLFAGLSLIQLIVELMFGALNSAQIPEGAPENILLITKIILVALAFLILLPEVYVGVKGLRVAKNPNSSKGHIIWAGILFAFSVLGLIEPVVAILKQGGIGENASALINILVDVAIYYDYIKHARVVAKLSE